MKTRPSPGQQLRKVVNFAEFCWIYLNLLESTWIYLNLRFLWNAWPTDQKWLHYWPCPVVCDWCCHINGAVFTGWCKQGNFLSLFFGDRQTNQWMDQVWVTWNNLVKYNQLKKNNSMALEVLMRITRSVHSGPNQEISSQISIKSNNLQIITFSLYLRIQAIF